MKKLITVLLLASSVLLSGQSGQTYYVAQNGNNSNSGTSAASPWRDLMYAVYRLKAGDTLCIGAGVWSRYEDTIDSQTNNPFPSGTDWNNAITVKGCNGDKPTLKPFDHISAVRLTSSAPKYWIFQDLIIDGSAWGDYSGGGAALIYTSNGTNHIRFQRIVLQHAVENGIMFSTNNAPLDLWIQNEVLDSELWDVGTGTFDTDHGGPGKNTGYASYDTSRGNIYLRNKIHDNNAFALVLYGSDHVVAYNEFWNNVKRGGGGGNINFGSSAHPINSENNFAFNNYIHDSNGNGIQAYTNSTSFIYNNTLIKIEVAALHIQYCISTEFKNNIFQNNQTDWINYSPESCPVTQSNNLFSSVNAKLVDPAKGNINLIDNTSPAYNTGVAIAAVKDDYYGTPRPQFGLFDIGASELKDGGSTPPDKEYNQPLFITTTTSVQTVPGKFLDSITCTNPAGNRQTVQVFDGTKQVLSLLVNSNQSLPMTSLNFGFTGTIGIKGTAAGIVCNIGVR